MISTSAPSAITGLPDRMPSYDGFCDDIEAMIRDTLPSWRVQVMRTGNASQMGEKDLTSRLCIYLNQTAREQSVSWGFHHEHPQRGSRSEDISLVPATTCGIWIEQAYFASHQRFYAIEAKRLPTPPDPKKERDREREYVCGDWQRAHDRRKPISGGIERFKENKHGEDLPRGGMVAFVQDKSFDHWSTQVNGWIADLSTAKLPCFKASWSAADQLTSPSNERDEQREHVSSHLRPPNSQSITLRHFWVQLS